MSSAAFIQFAGFTFGRSQSYFDFYANVMYYTRLYRRSVFDRRAGHRPVGLHRDVRQRLHGDDRHRRRHQAPHEVWERGTDALV